MNSTSVFVRARQAATEKVDVSALVGAIREYQTPRGPPLGYCGDLVLPAGAVLGWGDGEPVKELQLIDCGEGRLRLGARIFASLTVDPRVAGPSVEGGDEPRRLRERIVSARNGLHKAAECIAARDDRRAEKWLGKVVLALEGLRIARDRPGGLYTGWAVSGKDKRRRAKKLGNEENGAPRKSYGGQLDALLCEIHRAYEHLGGNGQGPVTAWPFDPSKRWLELAGSVPDWETWVRIFSVKGGFESVLRVCVCHEGEADGVAGIVRAKGREEAAAWFGFMSGVMDRIYNRTANGCDLEIPPCLRARDFALFGVLKIFGAEWSRVGGTETRSWCLAGDGYEFVPPLHYGDGAARSPLHDAMEAAAGWLEGLREAVGWPIGRTAWVGRERGNNALELGEDPLMLAPTDELDFWQPPGMPSMFVEWEAKKRAGKPSKT